MTYTRRVLGLLNVAPLAAWSTVHAGLGIPLSAGSVKCRGTFIGSGDPSSPTKALS